jgi:hypothetical protein
MWHERAFGLYPHTNRWVPHTPNFLWSFVGSRNFMRLSLMKGAHAVLSRAAYRKFGASRSFFARCGIPQASPSSLLRIPQICRGAPRSHQRTWDEKDGRSPPQPFVPTLTFVVPTGAKRRDLSFLLPGTHTHSLVRRILNHLRLRCRDKKQIFCSPFIPGASERLRPAQ